MKIIAASEMTFFKKKKKMLLIVVLLELFLGGNGYLIEFGGIRLRVFLYVVCLLWVFFRLLYQPSIKLPRYLIAVLTLFLFMISFGTFMGWQNGSRFAAITAELKSLIYFPLILFFMVAIKNRDDIRLVTQLIVICGLIQAILFLSLLLVMYSGIVSYNDVYLFLRASDEFIFRHNPEDEFFVGFLYKGALHLGVAGLFLLFGAFGKQTRWLTILLIIAVAFSLTRGIMLAAILAIIVGLILVPDKKQIFVSIVVIFIGITVQLTALQVESAEISSSSDLKVLRQSDSIRLADLKTVWDELDAKMFFVGRGLGAQIGERERIEMTYVEVFYKQGIMGLFFWGALLLFNYFLFIKVKDKYATQALSFFLSTLFVYFATASNTVLTGSTGMSIVLISTIVLMVFYRELNCNSRLILSKKEVKM